MLGKITGTTLLCAVCSLYAALGSVYSGEPSYGLNFRSHEVVQDERTSLDLTPTKPIRAGAGLTMGFDLKLAENIMYYGYVFRININDTVSLDMLTQLDLGRISFLVVDGGGIVDSGRINGYTEETLENRWFHVVVDISPGRASCMFDGNSVDLAGIPSKLDAVSIRLGKNDHPVFNTTDVAPMSVRNIEIDRKGKGRFASWLLGPHDTDGVYDRIAGRYASAGNADWQIDRHTRWKKIASLTTGPGPQVSFDPAEGLLLAATEDSLIRYSLSDNSVRREALSTPVSPYMGGGSQLFYHRGELYSYSLESPDLLHFDSDRRCWLGERYENIRPVQQHSRLAIGDSLLIFGGYGFHTFKSLLAVHPFEGGEWQIDSLAQEIPPRYLSAIGDGGDGHVYILGGYGTLTGRQEDSPRSFGDLYRVDYRSAEAELITRFDFPDSPVAFGNGLIIDRPGGKMYGLASNNTRYNTEICLMGVDPAGGTAERLSRSIPYRFRDTESYCDLFISPDSTLLYAVLLHSLHDATQEVEVYSLAYPPLPSGLAVQQVVPGVKGNWRGWIYALSAGLFLSCLTLLWIFTRRKSRAGKSEGRQGRVTVSHDVSETVGEQVRAVSRVILLGGFQVIDSAGRDITGQFTPVVRQVFLLMLLNGVRGGKGISSERLDKTLWFGMDRASASNNRSVNIRRLRKLLPQVGEINITHLNSYWKIALGGDVYCDFTEIDSLIDSVRKSDTVTPRDLEKILRIAVTGPMLPNLNAEWADEFKSSFFQSLADLLIWASAREEIAGKPSLMLKIAEAVLVHNSIDEDAIRIKCRTLFGLGQKGAARNSFVRYRTEYERLLGEPPDFTFEQIVE